MLTLKVNEVSLYQDYHLVNIAQVSINAYDYFDVGLPKFVKKIGKKGVL